MGYPRLLIIFATLSLLASGCVDGIMEVSPEANAPTPDAGLLDDMGADDVGLLANRGDHAGDTGGGNQNHDPNGPTCCAVGTVECVDDHSHRQCIDGGDGCGQWEGPSTCPNSEFCDDRPRADELCTACRDDDFAPDNFVSQTAPTLSVGTTLSDLVLCDNADPDITSHNFFYLGQVSAIDVELQWVESDGPLGLDFWTADTADADWAGRSYLADAGEHPSRLHHSQSLPANTHLFARVYFRTSSPPTAGASYIIAHANQ